MTKIIYLYCQPAQGWSANDVIGFAIAEDGEGLASHLSSNTSFSMHDMGLTSDWKHDVYQEKYPDGYKLEWVDDVDTHKGLLEALKLNEERYQKKIKNEALIHPDKIKRRLIYYGR